MLYIILLLILAVLLFGSSAVLGAIGWVFGLGAGIVALVLIKDRFGLDPGVVIIGGIAGLAALFGLLMLVLKMIEPWEIERMRKADAAKLKTGYPGGISAQEREAIRFAAAAKHHAKNRKKKG